MRLRDRWHMWRTTSTETYRAYIANNRYVRWRRRFRTWLHPLAKAWADVIRDDIQGDPFLNPWRTRALAAEAAAAQARSACDRLASLADAQGRGQVLRKTYDAALIAAEEAGRVQMIALDLARLGAKRLRGAAYGMKNHLCPADATTSAEQLLGAQAELAFEAAAAIEQAAKALHV